MREVYYAKSALFLLAVSNFVQKVRVKAVTEAYLIRNPDSNVT